MLNKVSKLLAHKGFIRYFKNTSWIFGEHMLRMTTGLFVGIWVARYLGPERFGIFSYVIAFTAIFSVISNLGLDEIIVRELIKHPKKSNIYLGTVFWLKTLGAIIAIGIIAIAIQFTSNDETVNRFIFIIAAGWLVQSFGVIGFYFQAQVLAKFISICKMAQLLLSSLIKIYLVVTEAELIWFVWVAFFDTLTLAIALFIAYQTQKQPNFYKCFDFGVAKCLLKDSWPLIFSSIAVMIYMRIDQIMIKEILGEHAVGIYSVAIRLSEVWYFIPMLITNSLFPAITNAKQINEKLYYQRLQRLYAFLIWTAIIIASVMTLFCSWLVTSLYGESYRAADQVLMIHIWAGIFVFMGVARGAWMLNENLQIYTFLFLSIGLIVNVLLNYYLISFIGINGAAYASLAAQCSGVFLTPFLFKKTRKSSYMLVKALFPWKLKTTEVIT